jgi:L-amino acid N-acyltransferase YncA
MIRLATPKDFSQLLDLQVTCIANLTSTYSAQEREAWATYIKQEGVDRYAPYNTYVFLADGRVVGFVSYSTNESEHAAAIECLYVAKMHQEKGLGKQLLQMAESRLPKGTHITIRSTLNARPFYESNGYMHAEDTSSRAGFLVSVMKK